jgi:hypothetical protein
MSKPPRAKMINNPELVTASRLLDLYALIPPARREFWHGWCGEQLTKLPTVIVQVQGNTKDDEPPLVFPPHDERHPESAA